MAPGERSRVARVWGDASRASRYATSRFPPGRERRERRAFERLASRLERGPQLDVPCGAGRLGGPLAKRGPVTGVDASPAMLGEAAKSAAYGALLRGDAFALPFRDGAFAGGACVRLLHHLDGADRRRVLTKLRRVCRGAFVVSFYDAATFQAWKAKKRRASRGSRKPISRAEFAADLAAAGLRAAGSSRPLPFVAEQTFVLVERA